MRINTHLNFNGQCEAAFRFYEKALGGKVTFLMTWGESPMANKVPLDWNKKIIHAAFEVSGGQCITGGDAPPNFYQKPQGFCVTINTLTAEESERIFTALADKGVVQMPMEETFWAKSFGMLIDQFGTPWMINCSKPD
jgi:PhnB protein